MHKAKKKKTEYPSVSQMYLSFFQLLELQAEYHKSSHEFLSKNICELKENHSQKGKVSLHQSVHLFAAQHLFVFCSHLFFPLYACLIPSGPPLSRSSQKVYGEPLLSHLSQSNREIAAPIQECIHVLLRTGMKEEVGPRR